jgi:hypothetical protein
MIIANLPTWPPWVDLTKLEQQNMSYWPCNVVPSCKEHISPSIEMSLQCDSLGKGRPHKHQNKLVSWLSLLESNPLTT